MDRDIFGVGVVGRLTTKDGVETLCIVMGQTERHIMFLDTEGNSRKVNIESVERFQIVELEDLSELEYDTEFYCNILHRLIYERVRKIDTLGYRIKYLRGGFLVFEGSGPYWKREREEGKFGYNTAVRGEYSIGNYRPISKEDLFNDRKAVHIRISRKKVTVGLLMEIAKHFMSEDYEHEIEVVESISEDEYAWDKLEMDSREIGDVLNYLSVGDLCYIKWGRMKKYEKVVVRSISNKSITVSSSGLLKSTLNKSSVRGIMGIDPDQKLNFMLENEREFAGLLKEMLNDRTEGHIEANNYVVSFDEVNKVIWVARKKAEYNDTYVRLGHKGIENKEMYKRVEVTGLFNGNSNIVGNYKDGLRIQLYGDLSEEIIRDILDGLELIESRVKHRSWEEAINKSIYADEFKDGDIKEIKLKGRAEPEIVIMRCVLLKGISAVGARGEAVEYAYVPDSEIEYLRDVSRDELIGYGEFRVEFGANILRKMLRDGGFKNYRVRTSLENAVVYIEKDWVGEERLAHLYVFGEIYSTYYEMRSGDEGDRGVFEFKGVKDSIAVRSRSGKFSIEILSEIFNGLYLVRSEDFSAGFDREFLRSHRVEGEENEGIEDAGKVYYADEFKALENEGYMDDFEEGESVLSLKLKFAEVKMELAKEREKNKRAQEKMRRIEELLEYIKKD